MTLQSIEKRLNRKPNVPSSDDPNVELRRLVLEHSAITKSAVAIDNMARSKKNRETGEAIPCRLPEDVALDLQETAKCVRKRADALKSKMTQQLRQIPIYTEFLQHVFGLGPIVSAYLVSEIDIERCTKPSQLLRFCGQAVINGKKERPQRGEKNHYSKSMRTRIYQAMMAMRKNGVKGSGDTKYLRIWSDAKHRKLSMGAKPWQAEAYGRNKATDILLEDIYIVWRALSDLEVWPSYYAGKLGYEHGGKICVNAPKRLTLPEALATVGNVGIIRAEAAE